MDLRAALFGLLSFMLLYPSVLVLAQTVPATPDSAAVTASPAPPPPATNPDADRLVKTEKDKGLSKPGRAALYSAVIPGAGQFYNQQYWKVPLIYAVGGALGYFIIDNNKEYQAYRHSYQAVSNPSLGLTPSRSGSATTLLNNRDFYRRNRDLTIILSVLAYGLNIMEANVAAHLREFDISDDLSLNWQPGLQVSPLHSRPTPGLTLNLRFKNQ